MGVRVIRAWAMDGSVHYADTLKRDPQERDPILKPLFEAAAEEADAELFNYRARGRGFCHVHWRVMQRILADKYDIQWKTLQQMNPGVRMD